VYHYFRVWRLDGTWETIHAHCVQWERVAQGHEVMPSAASLDSQSVKTATPAALAVGDEGIHFMKWTMDTYQWILKTVKHSDDARGFVPLPKRWVVERTWGWLNWSGRLSKDDEILPETSETFIYVAMIRIMIKRLEDV
jgi:transposase